MARVYVCFPVFHIRETISFYFQDANYAYATRQGILTKIRACEHLQKFCGVSFSLRVAKQVTQPFLLAQN